MDEWSSSNLSVQRAVGSDYNCQIRSIRGSSAPESSRKNGRHPLQSIESSADIVRTQAAHKFIQ